MLNNIIPIIDKKINNQNCSDDDLKLVSDFIRTAIQDDCYGNTMLRIKDCFPEIWEKTFREINADLLEFKLPTYLSDYLINNQPDALSDSDMESVDSFLESNRIIIMERKEDIGFCIGNDINKSGCECSIYTAKRIIFDYNVSRWNY